MQLGQVLQQRYRLEKLLGQERTWLANDLASQSAEQGVVKLLAQNPEWQDVQLFE